MENTETTALTPTLPDSLPAPDEVVEVRDGANNDHVVSVLRWVFDQDEGWLALCLGNSEKGRFILFAAPGKLSPASPDQVADYREAYDASAPLLAIMQPDAPEASHDDSDEDPDNTHPAQEAQEAHDPGDIGSDG
jgi:hypothetical protein